MRRDSIEVYVGREDKAILKALDEHRKAEKRSPVIWRAVSEYLERRNMRLGFQGEELDPFEIEDGFSECATGQDFIEEERERKEVAEETEAGIREGMMRE